MKRTKPNVDLEPKMACDAYAELFALSQSGRSLSAEDVMKVEQTKVPMALPNISAELRIAKNKSSLCASLIRNVESCSSLSPSDENTILVIDAMSLVCAMRTDGLQTFGDFADAFAAESLDNCETIMQWDWTTYSNNTTTIRSRIPTARNVSKTIMYLPKS